MAGMQAHHEDDIFHDDAPETPAPLFAFRAFKHAIFGTPKPGAGERKPRRRDLDSSRHPRSITTSKDSQVPARKQVNHTKSSSALTSPAKGILLTPGTANNRRKTVSFGSREQVQAQIAKDGAVGATPKDVPGRFPTPRTSNKRVDPIPLGTMDKSATRAASTTSCGSLASDHDSLSQRFKRLSTDGQSKSSANRDALLAKPPFKPLPNHKRAGPGFELYVDPDTADPPAKAEKLLKSAPLKDRDSQGIEGDGFDWKSHYESYATRSVREMRKMVKKEQLARKFAKEKDRELVKCQDALAKEQGKSRNLETLVQQMEQQLDQALQANNRLRHGSEIVQPEKEQSCPSTAHDRKQQEEARSTQQERKQDEGQKQHVAGMSSDIWAEAALDGNTNMRRRSRIRGSEDVTKGERAQETQDGQGPPHQDDRALAEEDQAPAQEQRAKGETALAPEIRKPKSNMTDERKEAAKRRLEERKRGRVQAAQ